MTADMQMRNKWRRVALLLLACALLLKLPTGFMPEANARGISFGWCNAVSQSAMAEGKALLEKALADRQTPEQKRASDEPCPFAATAVPVTPADPIPEMIAPAPEPLALLPIPPASPGRGLAAPPPLSTGPPLTA